MSEDGTEMSYRGTIGEYMDSVIEKVRHGRTFEFPAGEVAWATRIIRLKEEIKRLNRDLEASRAARDRETAILRAVEKERDRLQRAIDDEV